MNDTQPNPYRYLSLCAWGGPVLLVATILLWGVLGQNIPPYSAALSAQDFADQFNAHAYTIRIGMVGTLALSILYAVWSIAITKVMETIERDNNILSTLQLWGGALTAMIFVIPCGIWITATFRAGTINPEIQQMLYDLAWMIFDMSFSITTLQMVALGVGFLQDRRTVPLLPKWMCWFSMWVGFMFFLEVLNPFFKSGPFARSGILNYWIEFTIFFLFMALVSIYLLKAIARLESEHRNAVGTT